MAEQAVERKLVTILVADVAGYSRLMGENEEATLRTLAAYREVIDSAVVRHGGRVFSSAGDSVVAELVSPVEAVRCAIGIQKELARRNADLPENRRMRFRVGINLDDVMVEGDNLLGDGVNVAARLQANAEPGGIDLSASVFHQVRHKLDLAFKDLGRLRFKNIAKPVHAYRLHVDAKRHYFSLGGKLTKSRHWQEAGLAALALLLVGIAAVGWLRRGEPNIERDSAQQIQPARSEKPSLAVLPFSNFSGDSAQEYFADGLTDDLITDLSKVSGLIIIARNSTFTYKGKQVNVRDVGRELGVGYILEGSVRRAADQVRINVQLIDAATGGHLWAERYDGATGDIFALQDKITNKVVSALSLRLSKGEKEQVARRDTDDLEAYDAYLRGWEHLMRDSPEDLAEAIPFLEQAVQLDRDFARAHAALAFAYERSIDRGWRKNLGLTALHAWQRMEHHLQLAMRRPSSIAHLVKGRILLKPGQHRYDDALAEMERAVALDPNEFNAHANLALVFIFMGRPEEGIPHIEKALSVDPLNPARPLWMLGFAYFGMDRYDEAVNYMERAIKLRPYSSHWALIAAYAQAGRIEAAKETLKRYSELRKYTMGPTVSTLLTYHPYKHAEDRERLAQGLLAAGMSGYYDLPESNRLTGKEIGSVFFGRTVSGISRKTAKQYWLSFGADGVTGFRGGGRDPDSGRAWIDGDKLCTQWQDIRQGDERCVFVYRNPNGTAERLDAYVWQAKHYVRSWSVVD